MPAGIEVLIDTFRVDSPTRVYTAEEERADRRVAWRPEWQDQNQSPPVSPSFWASVRAYTSWTSSHRPEAGDFATLTGELIE